MDYEQDEVTYFQALSQFRHRTYELQGNIRRFTGLISNRVLFGYALQELIPPVRKRPSTPEGNNEDFR